MLLFRVAPSVRFVALAILRTIGYKAWIEGTNGKEIDETVLKKAIREGPHDARRRFSSGVYLKTRRPLFPKADISYGGPNVRFGPCVDGSELARTFFHECSIGRCSHVFGL
jgi:hypothetical protein